IPMMAFGIGRFVSASTARPTISPSGSGSDGAPEGACVGTWTGTRTGTGPEPRAATCADSAAVARTTPARQNSRMGDTVEIQSTARLLERYGRPKGRLLHPCFGAA